MPFNPKLLGERIHTLRTIEGLTQKELGQLRNSSQSTIAKQESGERPLGDDNLYWYAERYNVSADYLLGLIDEPRPLRGSPSQNEKEAPIQASSNPIPPSAPPLTAEAAQTMIDSSLQRFAHDFTRDIIQILSDEYGLTPPLAHGEESA